MFRINNKLTPSYDIKWNNYSKIKLNDYLNKKKQLSIKFKCNLNVKSSWDLLYQLIECKYKLRWLVYDQKLNMIYQVCYVS